MLATSVIGLVLGRLVLVVGPYSNRALDVFSSEYCTTLNISKSEDNAVAVETHWLCLHFRRLFLATA